MFKNTNYTILVSSVIYAVKSSREEPVVQIIHLQNLKLNLQLLDFMFTETFSLGAC